MSPPFICLSVVALSHATDALPIGCSPYLLEDFTKRQAPAKFHTLAGAVPCRSPHRQTQRGSWHPMKTPASGRTVVKSCLKHHFKEHHYSLTICAFCKENILRSRLKLLIVCNHVSASRDQQPPEVGCYEIKPRRCNPEGNLPIRGVERDDAFCEAPWLRFGECVRG